MGNKERLQVAGQQFKQQIIFLGSIIFIFWVLELFDWFLFNSWLDSFGIVPRTTTGLRGIFLGPFLHVGFAHVAANTWPFLILGWFVLLRGVRLFVNVSLVTAVISGLGTWLIGPANSVHIGASGLIFGYFGYLLLRGYFERSWSSVIGSIFIGFLYGGMLFGVLPGEVGISWQAHLFGFIGGILAAYLMTNTKSSEELTL